MTNEVLMGHLSWTAYDRRVKEDNPAVLIPVGSLEQHGPHLPLSTDALIPAAISAEVARRTRSLVAPAIAYGYKSLPRSGGGQHFPGTTSLDGATLIAELEDIVREFARHGVRKLAFVVGHLENQYFVTEACDLALRALKGHGVHDMRIMQIEYWNFTSPEVAKQVWPGGFDSWALEHAGIMETSVMLHFHPELVDMTQVPEHPPARFATYEMWPYDTNRVPWSGIHNTAKGATAEKGRLFADEYIEKLSEAIVEEFGTPKC
jgi:creatinine amidohydrolase